MRTKAGRRSWTTFGRCDQANQVVLVAVPPLTPDRLADLVARHEAGHAWGIEECLGKHPWCLMAEERQVGCKEGSFLGQVKLWLAQLRRGGELCPECRKYLEQAGAA
jgi:hypothetical protein